MFVGINITLKRIIEYNLSIPKIPLGNKQAHQHPNTRTTRETKRETRLLLATKDMVDGHSPLNNFSRGGGQMGVDDYIVRKMSI